MDKDQQRKVYIALEDGGTLSTKQIKKASKTKDDDELDAQLKEWQNRALVTSEADGDDTNWRLTDAGRTNLRPRFGHAA